MDINMCIYLCVFDVCLHMIVCMYVYVSVYVCVYLYDHVYLSKKRKHTYTFGRLRTCHTGIY